MAATATTIRLDPQLKEGLLKLSKLRATTLNKMISTALAEFVARDTQILQQELEASIKDLQRLSKQDPGFERAIARIVDAELATGEDPAEGTVSFVEEHQATDLVRELLSA